jgi:hypothetical protein
MTGPQAKDIYLIGRTQPDERTLILDFESPPKFQRTSDIEV